MRRTGTTVSTTDGGETPGWEVWFLLAVLAIGCGAALVVLAVGVGGIAGFESAPQISASVSPAPASAPVPEPGRMAVGVVGALVFGVAATWIIRTTDWANDLEPTE